MNDEGTSAKAPWTRRNSTVCDTGRDQRSRNRATGFREGIHSGDTKVGYRLMVQVCYEPCKVVLVRRT